MNRRALPCTLLLWIFSSLLLAPSARAQRARIDLLPLESSRKTAIEIGFEGRLFEPALDLKTESREAAIELVRRVIAASKETVPLEVKALWAPAERGEIEAMLNDAEAVERNRAYARTVERSLLHAEIAYGDVLFLVVEQPLTSGISSLRLYPTVVIDGQTYLTNRLQSDPILPFLRALLVRRFIRPISEPSPGALTP